MTLSAPLFRTLRHLINRPPIYPYMHGGERRRRDTRRADIHLLASTWAEHVPLREWYATDAEFEAATWVWDDGQRAITAALRQTDRRRSEPAESFATLLRGMVPATAGQ